MRVIRHSKQPQIEEVIVQFDPLVIWLDSKTELQIDRGDRLVKVTKKVIQLMPVNLEPLQVRQLVAYWFAMGERASKGRIDADWTLEELSIDEDRRYLTRRK